MRQTNAKWFACSSVLTFGASYRSQGCFNGSMLTHSFVNYVLTSNSTEKHNGCLVLLI